MKYSADINVMMRAIRKAAKRLVRDFGELENLQSSPKSLGDFVTASDINSENIIMEELSKARPSYSFLCEESGITLNKDKHITWIVDPLDGTINFARGISDFCISVALEKPGVSGKSEIVAGIIYVPIKGELFWAEKGNGAWFESDQYGKTKRLRVSNNNILKESFIFNGLLQISNPNKTSAFNSVCKYPSSNTRWNGSTALSMAYVAAGRADIFIQVPICKWDIAAGAILIQEAGGECSALEQDAELFNEKAGIIASNQKLHDDVVRLFAQS